MIKCEKKINLEKANLACKTYLEHFSIYQSVNCSVPSCDIIHSGHLKSEEVIKVYTISTGAAGVLRSWVFSSLILRSAPPLTAAEVFDKHICKVIAKVLEPSDNFCKSFHATPNGSARTFLGPIEYSPHK